MATCDINTLYTSLDYCSGENLLPGVKPKVYVLPKHDIVTWPTLPDVDAATDQAALASYSGNFTLAADKKWIEVDAVDNSGQITWETQGEKPCRTFLNKFTLDHPKINESAAGFQRQALSDDLVYLVQQRDKKFRVLGCEAYETTTNPKGATGQTPTERGDMGSQFEIEATDVCPAPFYPGEIVTEEGTISGATGEAVAAA